MAYRHALRISLGGLVAACCLIAALPALQRARSPIYTVTQLQAGLAHDPRAWTNRTLLLRGVAIAVGCWVIVDRLTADGLNPADWCTPPRFVPFILKDADPTAVAALPMAWTGPDPRLTVARRVPLLSLLLSAPRAVDWGKVATYRVELRAMPQSACSTATCYEAVLLDAAP
jgi:hypothetical protein